MTHRASYDVLIDEVWTAGNRSKRRWTVKAADSAVKTTIAAAKYMVEHYDQPAVLSAQGVDDDQYMECAREIVPLLRPGDIFGVGGWCITGKMPKIMLPVFRATMIRLIPYLAEHAAHRVHIWGVLYPKAIGELLYLCRENEVILSTDSVGPSLKPVWNQWGYADWIDRKYQRPGNDQIGEHRARHAAAVREWLSSLGKTRHCRKPSPPIKQPELQIDWGTRMPTAAEHV